MADHYTIFDRLKSIFGVGVAKESPRSDFRNPIWGDDDEDDDDLFERQSNIVVYEDPSLLHSEITKQVDDMMRCFGTLFGDMRSFFSEDFMHIQPTPPHSDGEALDTNPDTNRLRSYYLKPGYHNPSSNIQPHQDTDVDGKLSSQDLTGLLTPKEPEKPAMGLLKKSGGFFAQTVITTKITKPDGTVETHQIIRNGNEITEEKTTTGPSSPKLPTNTGLDNVHNFSVINNILSELTSIWSNIH